MPRGKGHCPNCGADKWAEIEAEFEHTQANDVVSCAYVHRILRCGGCDRIYFQTNSWFSEDDPQDGPVVTHWPPPVRRKLPKWLFQLREIDNLLYLTALESNVAANQELYTLAAIGIRTIFDRSAEMLGVDPNLNFADKLSALDRMDKISGDERAALEILTDAGSAAAHRAWRPTAEQLDTMMDVIESFIHRSFFVSRAAAELASQVPARPRRTRP